MELQLLAELVFLAPPLSHHVNLRKSAFITPPLQPVSAESHRARERVPFRLLAGQLLAPLGVIR